MISAKQDQAFETLVATAQENGVLDPATTTLIFLGASLAIRCRPCAERFIAQAKERGISDEQMGAAAAIAMCVRAGSARALALDIAGEEPEGPAAHGG